MWNNDPKKTAWKGNVGVWYKKSVGVEGSYYHQHVILPNTLRLLDLKPREKVIDFGCGQGVLGRKIENEYLGVDLSVDLIKEAKFLDKNPKHSYVIDDVCKELKIYGSFDKGVMILALQNVKKPFGAIKNFSKLLKSGGKLVLVINHPAFRIPKHSGWEMKEDKDVRTMDSYMSPLEIPIESSPFDKKDNQVSYSYHYPLSAFTEMLFNNGFLIEKMEEWISDKKSEGGRAKIEDKARAEFPLFLAIKAIKNG
ncbi:MAG: Methyltransferase domain protein [Candidatus Shapirobacteria bacterium GW2011_GWF1_38_23]|nr:MAG: Methyltransferase domain protein [Candidatus Shapirobacteria bacterium GW2011_GWF2_37_20]KKQ64399.1 MAG: Methyltransferase domain protein [Candidatus Shapirobacteria bacterium GW2011_GWF1_38_23]